MLVLMFDVQIEHTHTIDCRSSVRIPHYVQAFLLVLLTLGVTSTTAEERIDSIQWSINSAPPFHVFEGPFAGAGICDVLVDAIAEELPEIEHQVYRMPHSRISSLLLNQENMCFPCMIYRSSSSDKASYTNPTHIYRPHGIITNHRVAEEIIATYGATPSLAAILADKEYSFGQPTARKYGDLQPLIEAYAAETDLHVNISGDNNNVSLMNMIMQGRLDFTIDYDIIKRFYERTENEALIFLPIQENQRDYVLGAIGCTANEWGEQVTEEVNRVLPKVYQREDFKQALELWFGGALNREYPNLFNERVVEKYGNTDQDQD